MHGSAQGIALSAARVGPTRLSSLESTCHRSRAHGRTPTEPIYAYFIVHALPGLGQPFGQRGRPGRHGSASFGQSTYNLISQPLSTSRRSAPPPVIIIPQEGWPDLGRTERPLCCAHECWQGWATGGRATAARLRAVSSCRAARGTGRAHALFVCRGHKPAYILHARGAWGVRQVRAPPREGRTSFRLRGAGDLRPSASAAGPSFGRWPREREKQAIGRPILPCNRHTYRSPQGPPRDPRQQTTECSQTQWQVSRVYHSNKRDVLV